VKHALLIVLAAVFLVAGCGGDDEATTTETGTTTEPAETVAARVYWLRDGQVWPVRRDIPDTGQVNAALSSLLDGPTAQEEADLDLSTAIPDDVDSIEVVPIADGPVRLEVDGELSDEALAQVVYTVTQFADVESIEYEGRSLSRADFEDQSPPILVESPLAFEEVTSPVRATGTANTFEANFHYELTDTDGRIVDDNFVTATSGSGTRGTFGFTTAAFTVPFDGIGALIVFENSAEDGSRIHLVEIPLAMSK
jgi:germination protein M